MFEVKNLSKQYGSEFALRDVSMNIGKGMNFIVGASGSGKTTLLKILSAMEKGSSGSAFYGGKNISEWSEKEKSTLYNRIFGFVWQDFHLLEEATVWENVLLPAYLDRKDLQNEANRILKQLKLDGLKKQKVRCLSGGQKQRTAIARELMKNPQVIFCDEPTSALDEASAKDIMDVLRSLAKKKTVIVVTHDTSLIRENDTVFELDKGELLSVRNNREESGKTYQLPEAGKLPLKTAFRIALTNMKNKPGRFCTSILSLMIAGVLLLSTVSGTVESGGQKEFDRLTETYGEGILDISLIGSFMSASGSDGSSDKQPGGSVEQSLDGLYESYQNDGRVAFIVLSQAFENIEITLDGKTHAVQKTGNSPVLTKLLSGSVPSGEDFQVVLPFKFAESLGLTPESALGKQIDFSATVFQWIDNQPVEKPVKIQAVVCGVADNTVVYDYEGKPYSFTVDDSFFFNAAAIQEIRKQAGIEDKSANFTIRAKTPEDLISLKDELNKKGIVPLGRFELVEDIVRLNRQTAEQSGSASAVVGVLAVVLVVAVYAMTSVLRRREYAIYKVCGYSRASLLLLMATETVIAAAFAVLCSLVFSPLLNLATMQMFGASILSAGNLALGFLLICIVAAVSFVSELSAALTVSVSSVLKTGDKR